MDSIEEAFRETQKEFWSVYIRETARQLSQQLGIEGPELAAATKTVVTAMIENRENADENGVLKFRVKIKRRNKDEGDQVPDLGSGRTREDH